ncbi:MAG: hypothetical protein ABH950_06745 [Candidatus Altiarchaeota archaeon]
MTKVFPLGIAIAGIGKLVNHRDSETWGLSSFKTARKGARISQFLLKKGVRVTPTIAIVRLNQFRDKKGEKVEVSDLIKDGVLNRRWKKPVAMIRAFRTPFRVRDLYEEKFKDLDPTKQRELLDPILTRLNDELGIKLTTKEEYYDWFKQTYENQLKKMHELGVVHGRITLNNLTLACEFTDFDDSWRIRGIPKRFKSKFALRSDNKHTKEVIPEGDVMSVIDSLKEYLGIEEKPPQGG